MEEEKRAGKMGREGEIREGKTTEQKGKKRRG